MNHKTTMLLLLLLSGTLSALAQPVARDVLIRGNFTGYYYQNAHESSTNWRDWGFSINPGGGLFLTDHWLVHGSATYGYYRDINFDTNQGTRRHSVSVGGGTTYYFGPGQLRPFVFVGTRISRNQMVRTDGDLATPDPSQFNHFTSVGVGVSYWFTRTMAISGRTYLEGVGGFSRLGFGTILWRNSIGFQILIDRANPFRCP